MNAVYRESVRGERLFVIAQEVRMYAWDLDIPWPVCTVIIETVKAHRGTTLPSVKRALLDKLNVAGAVTSVVSYTGILHRHVNVPTQAFRASPK